MEKREIPAVTITSNLKFCNFSKNDTFRNSNYFKRNRICLIKDFNKTGFNKMNSSFISYNQNNTWIYIHF